MFCLYAWLGDLGDLESPASRASVKQNELLLFGRLNGKYLGKLVVPEHVDQACIHAVLADLQRQAHKLMPHEWRPPSHVLLQVEDTNLLPLGFMYKHDLDSTGRRGALALWKQCMHPSDPSDQPNKQESKLESKHITMVYDDNDAYTKYLMQCSSSEFIRHVSSEGRHVTITLHAQSLTIADGIATRLCNDFHASSLSVTNSSYLCKYIDFLFARKLSARKMLLLGVLPSTWFDFGVVELELVNVSVPPGISTLVSLKKLILENISEVPKTLKDLNLHTTTLWRSQACILKRLVTLLADMASLSELYLMGNAMRSEYIPSELGAMTSLARLEMHGNDFQGSIPSELGRLTNLDELSIREAGVFTDIPQEVLALQQTNTTLDIVV
jgi:hypothetical protein